MGKYDLLRAVRNGDASLVRKHYEPRYHDDALDAAAAARQERIVHMLDELRPRRTGANLASVAVSGARDAAASTRFDTSALLAALTHPQDALATTTADLSLYRAVPATIHVHRLAIDQFATRMRNEIARTANARLDADVLEAGREFTVEVRNDLGAESHRFAVARDVNTHEVVTERTPDLDYAYTAAGDRGPIVVFVHGVPTNREQWWPVQRTMSRWCRTLAIDLLGMGESSQPLDMPDAAWDWRWDAVQWRLVFDRLVRGLDGGADRRGLNAWRQSANANERIILVADDWGAGPATHFAELYGDEYLLGCVLQDPIALDGYPVAEIQAFGRLHAIFTDTRTNDDQKRSLFRYAVGAADQTMVQIFKTMVHDPSVYNQYALRSLKKTYVDVDYERLGDDYATSLSLRLNYHAIRVMAARAARLAPALLLPYDAVRNERGVDYHAIRVPMTLLWGARDNMMPAAQLHRLRLLLANAESVHTHAIAAAGHFAATDRPLAVASELLAFAASLVGIGREWRPPRAHTAEHTQPLADVFVGLTGIWKGDEQRMLSDLRVLYDVGE